MMVSQEPSTQAEDAQDQGQLQDHHGRFRYRKRYMVALLVYLALLITPWALTCVLMFRPINMPSYLNLAGDYDDADFDNVELWYRGIDIANRIAATAAVPVVSSLLAHGVVVYTQRRDPHQTLSLRQMMPLADRGWMDFSALLDATSHIGPSSSTPFLWGAAALILLAAVQPLVQSALVHPETIRVISHQDYVRYYYDTESNRNAIVGVDPHPNYIAAYPQESVIQSAMQKMIAVRMSDFQPNMWVTNGRTREHWRREHTLDPGSESEPYVPYFASALPGGTSTGVFRYHAAGISTRVTCQLEENFPRTCPGGRPFEIDYRGEERSGEAFRARICGEGRVDTSPWSRSRNKESIAEQLWIEFRGQDMRRHTNYTMRCNADSTRGWFELGNVWNDYNYGDMLDEWPDEEEIIRNYHDRGSSEYEFGYPRREEPDVTAEVAFKPSNPPTPGPLITAVLAMFGNSSFLHSAQAATSDETRISTLEALCAQKSTPFYNFVWRWSTAHCPSDGRIHPNELNDLVANFFLGMGDPFTTSKALEAASYLANEALLREATTLGSPREINSAPGRTVIKPRQSSTAIVVISVLVGVEAMGLLLLGIFIYSKPTWTATLDTRSMLSLGLTFDQETYDISKASGLVGVMEGKSDDGQMTQGWALPLSSHPSFTPIRVGLGRVGAITRGDGGKYWRTGSVKNDEQTNE
ncbi:hypothetical protein B0I35DRAFT_188452 [Stachybotrys elegans]|uniref:Uncharacterized protein n=1 Tax=Stachybotrys elegans TaxID=80388 RepID=A0A8K0WUR2_9HYPO|nr:hypothetical protein B0I35DRAFT_188452 [Stachybotrys elegans]